MTNSNYYINWLNSKCEREIYKFRQLPVDDSCNKARRIHIMAALVHGNDTLKKTWHRMPSGTTFLLIIKQTPSVLHVYQYLFFENKRHLVCFALNCQRSESTQMTIWLTGIVAASTRREQECAEFIQEIHCIITSQCFPTNLQNGGEK